MGFQVEDLGKNMVKLVIETSPEAFEEAVKKAYEKNKNKIAIQGFRKGKAPYAMVVKMYGKEMFYEDAANIIIPDAYEEAAKDCGFEIVSRPEIDVTQIGGDKPFVFTATVAKKPEVTRRTRRRSTSRIARSSRATPLRSTMRDLSTALHSRAARVRTIRW